MTHSRFYPSFSFSSLRLFTHGRVDRQTQSTFFCFCSILNRFDVWDKIIQSNTIIIGNNNIVLFIHHQTQQISVVYFKTFDLLFLQHWLCDAWHVVEYILTFCWHIIRGTISLNDYLLQVVLEIIIMVRVMWWNLIAFDWLIIYCSIMAFINVLKFM